MAETGMHEVFQLKVKSFNEAVRSGDIADAARIAGDIVAMGIRELMKTETSPSIRQVYAKSSQAVLDWMVTAVENSTVPSHVGVAGETDDPYNSTKQWFSDEVPNLNFTDIVGVQSVKDTFMTDIIAPLNPEFKDIYRRFRGDQMGSQILLYGPPGTGKTHIVKCLAGVLNCKIAVVQTSEVLASVVGVAEKNMRDIFSQAAELDRCIIFLDEIDSLCSDRESIDSNHTKSVLTTMLTCMDGFTKTTKPGQLRIVVAATNVPWKLDPALKRGGRFETQIYVPLPDESARRKFIDQGISKIPHAADVTADWLQAKLKGYSGADIKAVIRQTANAPMRRELLNIISGGNQKGEHITRKDFENVLKTYINPVTNEMLLRFKAYSMGISYEELMVYMDKISKGKKE